MIYLVRHAETEWSLNGKHTGSLSDIPITENGKLQAKTLKDRLKNVKFEKILVSPLQRTMETAKLAEFSNISQEPDLVEWNYGRYDGLTSEEISKQDPDWTVFTKGAPGGESVQDACERGDRVLKKVGSIKGNVCLVSSGHFLRLLATRWLQQDPGLGNHLALYPASISILGTDKDNPALVLWNNYPAK